LARLAKLNHYDPPSILDGLCLGYRNAHDQALRPACVGTLERIAALTGLDPVALYAATAHCFAPPLTPPETSLEWWTLSGGQTVPRLTVRPLAHQLRPVSAAQFCPTCIRQDAYHRLIWIPVAVSACLRHQCVLVDQCPTCRALVTIRSIVDTRCGRCQADLTQTRFISTRKDSLGMLSQQAIHVWLLGAPLPKNDSLGSLPDQPPAILYQVVNGLRLGILPIGPGWRYLHPIVGSSRLPFPRLVAQPPLTTDVSYRLFATAFKAIRDWPEGFYAFLRAYCHRGDGEGTIAWPVDPRDVYSQWFTKKWRHPAFQFVRDAFEEYLVDRYADSMSRMPTRWYHGNPRGLHRFAYATIEDAARLLHTSPEMVQRLAWLGRLRFLEPQARFGPHHQFVWRVEVLALRRMWHEALPLHEAACWLGVSVDMVRELVTAGLLTKVPGARLAAHRPSTGRSGMGKRRGTAKRGLDTNGAAQGLVSKQSAADLWSTVMAQAQLAIDPAPELIDLQEAMPMLSTVGLNAAGVIARVARGELRAYRPQSFLWGFEALLFSPPDLQMCVQTGKTKACR
jgi:hypothetical protein